MKNQSREIDQKEHLISNPEEKNKNRYQKISPQQSNFKMVRQNQEQNRKKKRENSSQLTEGMKIFTWEKAKISFGAMGVKLWVLFMDFWGFYEMGISENG